MKTNLCVVVFSIVVICTSCTKEKTLITEPDTPAMAIARSAIEKTSESLLSGKWQITSYRKINVELTESFKSYDFKFTPTGSLIAAKDGQNLTGKWIISYIDDLTRLSIDFSYPASFVQMSGDWTIVEEKEGKIKLQSVITPTDTITFETK